MMGGEKVQFSERVLMVGIGGACIVATTGLLMGWSVEQMVAPLASFGLGTFFPSLLEKETILDNK